MFKGYSSCNIDHKNSWLNLTPNQNNLALSVSSQRYFRLKLKPTDDGTENNLDNSGLFQSKYKYLTNF